MIAQGSAWARATPPGSTTTAIYFTLLNHSDSDISLTSASADISDRLELHTHISNDGMMKMQQVNSIIVPARGQATLKPHGDHVMVFNLAEQLENGKEVSVELTFSDNTTLNLTIPVHKEAPTGDASIQQEHHKHK